MRLTELFVNRPPLVFVALALVALLGSWSLATIVQQMFPNIDRPTVNVSVSYPGASPSELRDSVVRPIEDAIAGAPDLDHITTSIQQNQASISASFTLESDETTDLTEVQDRVQIVRSELPSDLPAPSIRTFDPAQATVVTLSLSSASLTVGELSAIITDKIVPALEQVPGVSNVSAGGTVTPALEVTVDPAKLSALGYTTDDVVSSIQQNNVRAPGGLAYLPGHETSIDVRGDVQTPTSIANLLLTGSTAVLQGATSPSGTITQRYTGATGATNQALSLGNSGVSNAAITATNPFSTSPRLVRIGDVAKVTDSFEPKRVYSYVDGRSSIFLGVQKATGASEVAASEAVLAALPQIEAQFPDVNFGILNVQADYTKQQLFAVVQTLLEGIVFTGVAMLFFLRSWRNALVVMVAIPTSLLVTFFVMRIFNYTIDTVSLLAMTLIIGILVDDSIVVLENIERHFDDGLMARLAAVVGRSEIGVAAIVITLVDVVVFLPIAFLPGQTGRFLSEFGVVVTIATLTSLAVSFTITPALAANWSLHSTWRAPRLINAFGEGFLRVRSFYTERILPWALRRPVTICAVSAVLTLAALSLVPLHVVGFEFMPAVDRGEVFVQVQFPTGTPLTTTDAAVRALTNRYSQLDGVQQIISTSGSFQAGFGGSINQGSNGQMRVLLDPDRKQTTEQIARMMTGIGHRLVPDAKVIAIPATGIGGGNSQPIDFTVSTTRGDPTPYAAEILQALQDTPGTAHVNSSALNLAPQIDIEFDRDRARALDLDIGTAAQAVRAAFGGTLATQFDTSNGTKYVQVLYPIADQTSLATLREIALRTRTGAIVHLGDVAVLKNAPAQPLITRVNRETVIHLSANVEPGAALSTVQAAFQRRVQALHLPNTVIIAQAAGGIQQNLLQAMRGIGVSLILSSVLVYLLMVALYDAYRAPLVVMFSVPVAAIGAFGALWITHQSFNLNSLIGLVMLIGLVSKNGILLIDFARVRVLAGLDKATAIRQAARERFRPILMTTLAMIAGMTPMALALDPGSVSKRSLGTVVIGGLTSSLLLTLVLIPVVYCWLAPGPSRRAAPSEPEGQPTPVQVPVETH
jgi:hydrophobic/amphiphilic exporter-1 (mainly G- bacteria), HAE1 family